MMGNFWDMLKKIADISETVRDSDFAMKYKVAGNKKICRITYFSVTSEVIRGHQRSLPGFHGKIHISETVRDTDFVMKSKNVHQAPIM